MSTLPTCAARSMRATRPGSFTRCGVWALCSGRRPAIEAVVAAALVARKVGRLVCCGGHRYLRCLFHTCARGGCLEAHEPLAPLAGLGVGRTRHPAAVCVGGLFYRWACFGSRQGDGGTDPQAFGQVPE